MLEGMCIFTRSSMPIGHTDLLLLLDASPYVFFL